MLVRNVRSSCSSVMSSSDCWCSWKAALLTRMSSRPNSSTVRSTAASQKLESVTSPGIEQRAAPLRLDRAPGLLGVLVLAQVDDGDVGALAREEHRHRPADARVAAGDERDLVLELARPAIVRRQILRPRVELGLQARLPEMLLRQRRLGIPPRARLRRARLLRLAVAVPAATGLGFGLQLSIRLGLRLARGRPAGLLRAGPARALLLYCHVPLLKV